MSSSPFYLWHTLKWACEAFGVLSPWWQLWSCQKALRTLCGYLSLNVPIHGREEDEQVRQRLQIAPFSSQVQISLIPCGSWALFSTAGAGELCEMHLLLHFVIPGAGCANGGLQSLLLLSALSAQGINKFTAHTPPKAEEILQEAVQCGSHKSPKKWVSLPWPVLYEGFLR